MGVKRTIAETLFGEELSQERDRGNAEGASKAYNNATKDLKALRNGRAMEPTSSVKRQELRKTAKGLKKAR